MAGRHEPDSSASLYFSAATAALRVGLVVAAVVLGVIVLGNAFPESETTARPQASPSPTAASTTPPGVLPPTLPVTISPTPAPGPTAGATQPPPATASVQDVALQVLNGTNESGLAAATAEKLEQLGYKIVAVGNAARTYPTTTLFYRPDSQAEAQQLAQALFPAAMLEPATNNLDPDLQVTVVLGEDYAAQA